MDCKICSLLDNSEIIGNYRHYAVIKDKEGIKAILKYHQEEPDGCKQCVKGYMRKTLHVKANALFSKEYTIKEYIPDGHLLYEAKEINGLDSKNE